MPWVHVAHLSDFGERAVIGVTHEDRRIALYKLEDGTYATTNVCTHQAATLSEGEVDEGYIECPGHYALFEIRTGKATGGLAKTDLTTFPVKVDGSRISVLLE